MSRAVGGVFVAMSPSKLELLEQRIRYLIRSKPTSQLRETWDGIKKLLLVCHYCGKVFSSEVVNYGCYVNRTKILHYNCKLLFYKVKPFTINSPPEHIPGSSKHFWDVSEFQDNILSYFQIIDHEGKLVVSQIVDRIAQFYFSNIFLIKQ